MLGPVLPGIGWLQTANKTWRGGKVPACPCDRQRAQREEMSIDRYLPTPEDDKTSSKIQEGWKRPQVISGHYEKYKLITNLWIGRECPSRGIVRRRIPLPGEASVAGVQTPSVGDCACRLAGDGCKGLKLPSPESTFWLRRILKTIYRGHGRLEKTPNWDFSAV